MTQIPSKPNWLVRQLVGTNASNALDVPGGPNLPQNQTQNDDPPMPHGMPQDTREMFAAPSASAVEAGPRDSGDQGISEEEAPYAQRLERALLDAPGTALVATVRDGTYELRGKHGAIRFRRYREPTGAMSFKIVGIEGVNPLPGVDPRALDSLEKELRVAGGAGKPVPFALNSFPDIARRVAQLFDHEDAPDLLLIPLPGSDPDITDPAVPGGMHGGPDIIQSRAPLIIAGPGIASGVTSTQLVRTIDIAPTVAAEIGIKPLKAQSAGPVQYLRGQDGASLIPPNMAGKAEQALIFVLDGTNANVLRDELVAGHLPNIASIVNRGTLYTNGTIAEAPTETWANHATLLTGAQPGRHGIVGNGWFDREIKTERHTADGANSKIFWNSSLLDPRVETLYEAARRTFGTDTITAAINEPQGRGATISTLDTQGIPTLASQLPWLLADLRHGNPDATSDLKSDATYRQGTRFDRLGTSILSRLYKPGQAGPKIAVLEQFLTDNMGHRYGAQSTQVRAALAIADANIGRVLVALKKTGKLDATMIVITADHGNEHQQLAGAGGWKHALDASGVKAVEVEHLYWLRTMRIFDAGSAPGMLKIRAIDDDTNARGSRPPIQQATVIATTVDGTTYTGTTNALGIATIALPANVTTDALRIAVKCDGYTQAEVNDLKRT